VFGKWRFVTPVYHDTEKRSLYQNVQFFFWRNTGVLTVVKIKYLCNGVSKNGPLYYHDDNFVKS